MRIRLRTQNGDLGPLQQTASETVGDVKRRLVADWSKLIADASITSAEAPTAITDVKLILNGKFLDNDESLGDVYKTLTDPGVDTVLTMHAVIRPQSSVNGGKSKGKGKDSKSCGCVIC